MESLPIIELEAALDRCDQDIDLYKELISIFRQDFPSNIAEIKECLINGDWETSTRVAHSIKGALGNLGAPKGSKCAYSLEVACRNREQQLTVSMVEYLVNAVAEFDKEISNRLNIPPT